MKVDLNALASAMLWVGVAINLYFGLQAARRARFFREAKSMVDRGEATMTLALSAARLAAMVHLKGVEARKHDLVDVLQKFVKADHATVRQMLKVERAADKLKSI